MQKLSGEAEQILVERFGKDTVIALATTENGVPHVRSVNLHSFIMEVREYGTGIIADWHL